MEETNKANTWAWQDKSTAATIGLFVVSGITGLMLFLKIGEGALKGIHEWLSVAFVIAAMLHVVRHWRPMQRYFKMQSFWGITVIVLLLVVVMMVPGNGSFGPRGHHPMVQVIDTLGNAKLENLALTMNTSSDALVQKLSHEGITVQNTQQTLQEVAKNANCDLFQVMSIVIAKDVTQQTR